jgi:phosphoglycolate phosphatase
MSAAGTTVVLWDIDGTLLTTGRAGIKAWEQAAVEVLGYDADLTGMRTSGLTDLMIAREIVVAAGRPPEPALERRLADAYTRALPACLTPSRGGVLHGVVEVLDALSGRPAVYVALLTGNMRAGARAKLDCYGLTRYFDAGGFGDDGFDRAGIGRVALERVERAVGTLDLDRVFLVGDSPYDVACAAALGIRMIAVASGEHGAAELATGQPWWGLDRLPGPDEFLARLGLEAAPPGAVPSTSGTTGTAE